MATPRLAESRSRRISDSPSFRLNSQRLTLRLGESFFDYEYLRELEAKIGTARKVVKGIYEEPISAKTPENPPHCHVPLNKKMYTKKNFFFRTVIEALVQTTQALLNFCESR
jgi:hypothetical protein